MEGDPFALIEAMTIAALRDRLRARLRLPARRVPAGAPRSSATRSTRRARARLPRRRRAGRGLRVRHRDPPGRRRLHLRRGDGALQLDRGLPRRAAQQAAVPGRGGPVRQADRGQQRRDAGQRARRSCSRAAPAFAAIGTEGSTGTKLFCLSRPRRAPGRLRGAVRHDAAASCSTLAGGVAGGRPLQAVLLGGAAGGFVGPTSSTCRSRSRARASAGDDARLGRRAGVRRHASTCRACCMRIAAFFRDESCGQCVPCRVGTVRQQEALARLVSGRTRGGAATSSRCSARSASACATRRSAASARPRRARSSRRSSASASSGVRREQLSRCSCRGAWSSSRSTGSP